MCQKPPIVLLDLKVHPMADAQPPHPPSGPARTAPRRLWTRTVVGISGVAAVVFAIILVAYYAINTVTRGLKDQKMGQKAGISAPAALPALPAAIAAAPGPCKPVYLTFNTAAMDMAPLVAEVLRRQQVQATFFAANERTTADATSLGDSWAPWWKARAAEGHAFAPQTYDHAFWRGDVPGIEPRFRIRTQSGAFAGREFTYDAAKYCAQISQASSRLQDITGQQPLPLFRAPGGQTSPKLLAVARACGFEHVGWSGAGLLGDQLPSGAFPNAALLKKALQSMAAGDVLLAHLGTGPRQDPWAPAALEPLLEGLKADGFCFKTLREHPLYQPWIKTHTPAPTPVAPAAAK